MAHPQGYCNFIKYGHWVLRSSRHSTRAGCCKVSNDKASNSPRSCLGRGNQTGFMEYFGC